MKRVHFVRVHLQFLLVGRSGNPESLVALIRLEIPAGLLREKLSVMRGIGS